MSLILDGTNGLSDVDGTAAAPAIRGTDANTGIFFPTADTIAFAEGGAEAMRIDSSGNVGIGTTSPAAKVEAVAGTGSQGIALFRTGDATAANNAGGGFNAASSATAGSRNARIWLDADGANFSGSDYFYIDKVGNSGDVNLIQQSNAAMTFQTNGSERARIDSSGAFLLTGGNTSTSVAASVGFRALQTGFCGATMSASTNATDTLNVYSTGAANYRFYVGLGGTVFATSATITAISDQRWKENIRDLDDGLEKVMALQPRKFNWKEGKGAGTKDARGFIAQEFETVFPDMIEEWKDPVPEGEEPYKAVNANLIPTLVKAIQEQQALITALTTRITALEAA